jgi:hypothetical protein
VTESEESEAAVEPMSADELSLVAKHRIGRLETLHAAGNEQLAKTGGWLVASLLAVNGGGALASLNVSALGYFPRGAAIAFGMGIVFAAFNAVGIQSLTYKMLIPLENLLAYWRGVEIFGEEDQDEFETHQAALIKAAKLQFLPHACGWISGLLFIAGAILLGLGAQRVVNANSPRCAALQSDMLLVKPKRSDSGELFKTLNCQSQGSGAVQGL